MNHTMLAVVTALAVGAAVSAHAENERSPYGATRPVYSGAMSEVPGKTNAQAAGNAASLSALSTEWDQAAFNAPSKPSQYRVYGRNGYVTDGPGYNAMVSTIRAAVNDAQKGHNHGAATNIAKARSLLAASNQGRA